MILLLVFGSLVGASIPLLLAATTVVGHIRTCSQAVGHWSCPINSATSAMMLLMAWPSSVDYSLFYLRRVREERAAGRDVARGAADYLAVPPAGW